MLSFLIELNFVGWQRRRVCLSSMSGSPWGPSSAKGSFTFDLPVSVSHVSPTFLAASHSCAKPRLLSATGTQTVVSTWPRRRCACSSRRRFCILLFYLVFRFFFFVVLFFFLFVFFPSSFLFLLLCFLLPGPQTDNTYLQLLFTKRDEVGLVFIGSNGH